MLQHIKHIANAFEWAKQYIMGLRKYSFTMLLLGISTYLVYMDIISGDNFEGIMVVLAASFPASNLLEHYIERKAKK